MMASQPETGQAQRIEQLEEAVASLQSSMAEEVSKAVSEAASEMQHTLVSQITASLDQVTQKLQVGIDRLRENNETLIEEVRRRQDEFQSEIRSTISSLKTGQTQQGSNGAQGNTNEPSSAPTSFNDLTEESTLEIFLRLPVKALIRSTSVNKTWHSLINNPSFISSQIRNAISSCDHDALLIIPPITSHQNYCSLISAHTSSLIEKFDIPFETKTRSLRLVAEIHGLLLLTDLHTVFSSRDLYLWNPYVKRHRVLVSTCFKKHLADRDENYYFVAMGFDKVTDDYKVIRIFYVNDDKGKLFGDVAPKVEIFSLRRNTWRKMKNPRVPRLVHEHGIYFDGCYYWLELNQPGSEEARACYGNKLRIMSFDFHTELFAEFKVPHDVPRDLGKFSPHKLMQFEDSLALCVVGTALLDNAGISYPHFIWLMRQENGVVTWTLRFRALLKKCGYPLGITKNGTLVIESVRSRDLDVTSIVSCNLKSMIHKDHGFGKARGPETSEYVLEPSTVGTSFPESLVMYDGGKSLLKYAK